MYNSHPIFHAKLLVWWHIRLNFSAQRPSSCTFLAARIEWWSTHLHLVVVKSLAYNICSNFTSTPPQPNNYKDKILSPKKTMTFPLLDDLLLPKRVSLFRMSPWPKKHENELKLSCGVRPTNRSSKDTDSKLSQSGIKNLKTWLVGGFNRKRKNTSQIGSFPQIGVNIKNVWNHHLGEDYESLLFWFNKEHCEFWGGRSPKRPKSLIPFPMNPHWTG